MGGLVVRFCGDGEGGDASNTRVEDGALKV